MKVTLPRHEFQDGLGAVAHVTSGRTTKPILACVKLACDGERLELSGTDGEVGLRISVPCLTSTEGGETVVSAARLHDIIRELPDAEVTLEADDRHCVVRGEGSEFKLFVQAVSDFPPVPDFTDAADLVVDGNEFRRMVDLTIYAAARETSRYAINGVLWQKKKKRILMVATDGRRLAKAGGPVVESSTGDFDAIIPSKALHLLSHVFPTTKGDSPRGLEVKVLPNQVLLRGDGRVLAAALVEGTFPDYEKVVPQDCDKEASFDRTEFYAAIRRANLLTTEDSRAVRLMFEPERLTIRSSSPEQGEARVELPVEYDGPAIDIGFNPNFLMDALKVVSYDRLTIELKESFKPGLLSGGSKDEFLYVLMPVSIG